MKELASVTAGGRDQVRLGYQGPGRRMCPSGGHALHCWDAPHLSLHEPSSTEQRSTHVILLRTFYTEKCIVSTHVNYLKEYCGEVFFYMLNYQT